ncbi:transcriptional regulator [Haloprofundus marisrubri]|uniref:Transcriptional regulator n=1 Tax=Haloprofundus marisrubri TaxID=1514971 RepID=A0A0W1R5Z7_9EURY|nr:hypothetical protein [Haloprofundus marisrubri]KTG08777.1 transcriptional regulator [Haloprofundus marisrubri]
MSNRLDDIEFLARSEHRVLALEALVRGPRSRRELLEATEASSSTVGRVLGDFDERQWVVRDGRRYELTSLGRFIADRFLGLVDAMAMERKLRDVWPVVPGELREFSVDQFTDAVVSYPGPGYPYEPVERVGELIDETDRLRGFGTTILKTRNVETVQHNLLAGMEMEYIYSPRVLESVVSSYPEQAAEALGNRNCTVLVHENLPDEDRCGVSLFDERVCICCLDPDTGLLHAVVDTDAPDVRAWAESLYEQYRTEAEPLEARPQTPLSDRVA